SLSPEALEEDGKLPPKLLDTLVKFLGKGVDTVVTTVFLNQPNDIAVTLESIKRVNSARSPQPKILPDPACDHLTYFVSEPGLECLKAAQTAALEGNGIKKSEAAPVANDVATGTADTMTRGIPAPAPEAAPQPPLINESEGKSNGIPPWLWFVGIAVIGGIIAVAIAANQPKGDNAPSEEQSRHSPTLVGQSR
ncbi:MAG: hypothetical protein AAGF75_08825, partial [Cyanobacteria bacterium P01_H01_bin.130]